MLRGCKMFFDDCKTQEDLKTRFKSLAKKHHPDLGGDAETMKAINAEYDVVIDRILRNCCNLFGTKLEEVLQQDKELRETLESISGLHSLNIEICGSWIWVTGETLFHKEALKGKGFKWARKKKAWYFYTGEYRRRGKKDYTMDYIRAMHGTLNIKSGTRLAIA